MNTEAALRREVQWIGVLRHIMIGDQQPSAQCRERLHLSMMQKIPLQDRRGDADAKSVFACLKDFVEWHRLDGKFEVAAQPTVQGIIRQHLAPSASAIEHVGAAALAET